MEKIESYELQTFPINARTINNLNTPNKEISTDFDIGDGFIHPHFGYYYMEFEVRGRDANGEYSADADLKLVDNFFPNLFSQLEVKKHGFTIDKIDLPGITTTAVNTARYSKIETLQFKEAGFETSSKLGKTAHEVLFPLRLFPGFFYDYRDIFWKGGLTITLTRASNDDNCLYRWNTAATGAASNIPHAGKVVIKHLEVRMPIVEYDPNYADKMRASLLKTKIPISFNICQTISKAVTGTHFEFDLTTQFNSLQFDMPDWVFVVFQTGAQDNQEIDNSLFHHCKVKNIDLINGRNEIFPKENWNLDLPTKYYKLYEAYTVFKRITCCNTEMYYSPEEFIEKRPMYILNLTRRKQVPASMRTHMKLRVDFASAVGANTMCYVIMIGRKNYIYDAGNEKVIEKV